MEGGWGAQAAEERMASNLAARDEKQAQKQAKELAKQVAQASLEASEAQQREEARWARSCAGHATASMSATPFLGTQAATVSRAARRIGGI